MLLTCSLTVPSVMSRVVGDLAVAAAADEQPQDVQLARRQLRSGHALGQPGRDFRRECAAGPPPLSGSPASARRAAPTSRDRPSRPPGARRRSPRRRRRSRSSRCARRGTRARIACIVSVPLTSGSRRSISVTSGRWVRIERPRLLAARRFRADDHVGLERHDAGQAHPDQVVIVDQHQFQLVRHDAPSAPAGRSLIRRCAPRRNAHRQTRARARRAAQAAARRQACRRAHECRAGRNDPPGRSSGSTVSPQPSSSHRELDAVRLEPQQDVDPPRAGMLQRVGERLEADAQQVVLVRTRRGGAAMPSTLTSRRRRRPIAPSARPGR